MYPRCSNIIISTFIKLQYVACISYTFHYLNISYIFNNSYDYNFNISYLKSSTKMKKMYQIRVVTLSPKAIFL